MDLSGKILLVDDEVAVRNLYQLYMEAHGLVVISASSVGEALRVLRQENIAVIVLDVFLQEESGMDLLHGIVAAGSRVPVIIMSGASRSDPIFQDALNGGAAGVFAKAFPLDALLREISRVSRSTV